jgi:hypothetical protein
MTFTPTVPAGQGITVSAVFNDASGLPADPSAGELIITDPLGATTSMDLGVLEHPSLGAYSRTLTPTTPGRWTYVFQATAGLAAALPGVFYVAPDDWEPTVADIGRKLRSRTKDTNGDEVGTFTSATRPDGDEVAAIIREETTAIAGFVGPDIPISLYGVARTAALNRIAARIELDYFPEQIPTGRSPYEQLIADRDVWEQRLVTAVREHTASGEAGGSAIGAFTTTSDASLASVISVVGNGADIPPYSPTGWPIYDPSWGGTAGSPIV